MSVFIKSVIKDVNLIIGKGDINFNDWNNITNFKVSENGSGGVFFVNSESGTVAVKGCSDTVQVSSNDWWQFNFKRH